MLLIGALLRDQVARFLEGMAVAGIVFACVFVLSGEAERWSIVRPEVLLIYPGIMSLLAAGYGYWLRNRWYRAISLLILASWSVALGGRGYGALRTAVAGLDEIALGMACLLVGLMVSLWKLGVPQSWWAWWIRPHPVPIAPTAEMGDEAEQ
jgi:hypothetical protein